VLDAVPGGRDRSKDDVRACVSTTFLFISPEGFLCASGLVQKSGCSWAPARPSSLKEATW